MSLLEMCYIAFSHIDIIGRYEQILATGTR